MDDVVLGDVVHEVLAAEAEFAIHGRRGAFQERPGLGLVFGYVRVRVVEVGDGYDPVVHPHVRQHVEQRDGFEADLCACVPESRKHQSDADVGSENQMPLFRSEERTGG